MNLPLISGKTYDPFTFKASDINAWDIAWGLSNLNTYMGHTPIPWSVLSHTGLMFVLLVKDRGEAITSIDILSVLLSKASEAYFGNTHDEILNTGSFNTPSDYKQAIQRCIHERFGLKPPDENYNAFIQRYKERAEYIERLHFFPEFVEMKHVDFPTGKNMLRYAPPVDFVEILKQHTSGVPNPAILFECPERLKPYLSSTTNKPDPNSIPQN